MLEKFKNITANFTQAMVYAGRVPNAFVQFLSVALGNNTGKLLSICTVLFGLYIMWIGFFGQIETVYHLAEKEKPTPEEQAVIRETYKEAMTSVAVPLGILIGAVPTIIGIGLMKKREEKNKAASADTTPVENVPYSDADLS